MAKVSEESSVEAKAGTTARLDNPPNADEQLSPETGSTSRTSAEKNKEKNISSETQTTTAAPEYPKPWKLSVIVAALCLAVFLVALDQTIVAVAVPKITDHFHSLDDVGWHVYHRSLHIDQLLMLSGMVLHICSPEPHYSPASDESILNLMCVGSVR